MRQRARSLIASLSMVGALVTGCGLETLPPPSPAPAQIPGLESRLASNPEDAEALWRLGAARRAAGDVEGGIIDLERAVQLAPDLPEPRFFLGIAYEETGRAAEAIASYSAYQRLGGPGAESLDGRLELLRRQEIRSAIEDALSREAELRDTPPQSNTIAVFPFRFLAEDESLGPLAYALADMLVTDLSQTDRLRVLERVRVQALVDELALSEAGYVDPANARRSGYLIGAGQVVQGSIAGSTAALQLDASVVAVSTADASNPVSVQDPLAELLDMEKELALAIYEELGVVLTPAERQRVNERPTENIQAVLAYGLGLRATDLGDYQEARAHFQRASALDPSFSLATQRARDAQGVEDATEVTADQLGVVEEIEITLDDIVPETLIERDAAAEILGTEGVASSTILEIIIRISGGGS